eukprot:TRINITY_DN12650_c0_g1_i5.p1 TRINITY_DN12650_c0_g1~~TRINITY_DN12650_c0_g1_i5.p1  ORF type:complete len:110 (-),score=36.11 TRINITY_DN12650_c0_g1_i5:29-358(-)
MSNSDSEEEKRVRNLPKYKLRHNDMPIPLFEEVLTYAEEATNKFPLDKDAAVEIARLCKAHPKLGDIDEGEWQVIIGKSFGASVNFDSRLLAFFDLVNKGKTFLIFKSG